MKEKLVKLACLALAVAGGLELLGNVAAWVAGKFFALSVARGDFAAVGVIGGADGPTAVFVTGPALEGWLIPLAMVAVGLLGLYGLKKCNK